LREEAILQNYGRNACESRLCAIVKMFF